MGISPSIAVPPTLTGSKVDTSFGRKKGYSPVTIGAIGALGYGILVCFHGNYLARVSHRKWPLLWASYESH